MIVTDSLSSASEAEMRTSWPSRYSVVIRSLHCTSSPSGPPLKAFSAILKPDSLVSRPKWTRIWRRINADISNPTELRAQECIFPGVIFNLKRFSQQNRGGKKCVSSCKISCTFPLQVVRWTAHTQRKSQVKYEELPEWFPLLRGTGCSTAGGSSNGRLCLKWLLYNTLFFF